MMRINYRFSRLAFLVPVLGVIVLVFHNLGAIGNISPLEDEQGWVNTFLPVDGNATINLLKSTSFLDGTKRLEFPCRISWILYPAS
jgi:hypothetical protein